MKKSEKAVFFIAGLLLTLVFLAGCISTSTQFEVQKPAPSESPEFTHITTQTYVTRTTPDDEKISEKQVTEIVKEKILEFSKNTSLNLTFDEINHQPYADLYRFDADHSFFIVNNKTGRVQSANWNEAGSKSQKEIIDLDQGYAIAESFTREKYPEFWNISDTRGIKVMRKEALDRGGDRQFHYEWWEIFYMPDKNIPTHSEIPGLNTVYATISPYTGHVISYHESYTTSVISGSSPVDLIPKLTEDEAKKIAEVEFRTMGENDNPLTGPEPLFIRISPDKNNTPHLVWNFKMTRTEKMGPLYDPFEYKMYAYVSVDAHDGTIVQSMRYS